MLSSLPFYQASFLLDLKMIMDQITKIIWDLLWQGGKGNQKKFHLVKWDTVKRLLAEGGLQIWDLGLVNLALGCKFSWNLHSNSKHPVSRIMKVKYMRGEPLRNL